MAQRRVSKARANALNGFFSEDTLTPKLKAYPGFVDRAVAATVLYYEPQAENYAKLNAKWKDHTTNARNGLRAKASKGDGVYRLTVFHQMPYGIWLETRFDGRYAIIMPTIREIGPRILGTIRKILERKGSM